MSRRRRWSARARWAERRVLSASGVVFACIYATIEIVNYGLQLLAVSPSIQSGETEGLAFFAFTNPHGFFAALETLSYPLMLLALLFAAPVFRARGLEQEVLFATAMVLVAMFFHRARERAMIGRGGQSSPRRNGGR